jgi:hypothetical protein
VLEQRIISRSRSLEQAEGLEFQEWRRHFVVENVQISTDPFGDFVPNFSLRDSRAGLQKGIDELIFS